MKQPNPQRWAEYMRECAERCRRQLAAAQVRAGIRPRITGVTVSHVIWDDIEERIAAGMDRDGHTREMGWYEGALRRGCTDE